MFSTIKMAMSGTSYNEAQAFSELCRIVREVSRDITELFGQLIAAISTTCMPDLEMRIEDHPDGPKLSTLGLPYFVEFDAVTKADDK